MSAFGEIWTGHLLLVLLATSSIHVVDLNTIRRVIMPCRGIFLALVLGLQAPSFTGAENPGDKTASSVAGGRTRGLESDSLPFGILLNYPLSNFAEWIVVSEKFYGDITTQEDLQQSIYSEDVYPYVCIAALYGNSATTATIAACGERSVVSVTTSSTTIAYAHNGAYWYFTPSQSLGFARSETISLNSADVVSSDCAYRLSWHLSGGGGWRAGCSTGLNGDRTWKKVVYLGGSPKDPSSSPTLPPSVLPLPLPTTAPTTSTPTAPPTALPTPQPTSRPTKGTSAGEAGLNLCERIETDNAYLLPALERLRVRAFAPTVSPTVNPTVSSPPSHAPTHPKLYDDEE